MSQTRGKVFKKDVIRGFAKISQPIKFHWPILQTLKTHSMREKQQTTVRDDDSDCLYMGRMKSCSTSFHPPNLQTIRILIPLHLFVTRGYFCIIFGQLIKSIYKYVLFADHRNGSYWPFMSRHQQNSTSQSSFWWYLWRNGVFVEKNYIRISSLVHPHRVGNVSPDDAAR